MAASAAELATMYVSIVPSFKEGSKALEAQLRPALRAAGTKAGKDFASSFGKQEISAAQIQKFSADVQAASAKVTAARQKEEDAAGALRVAEARLSEVRASGRATASQLIAAEERVATASRRVAAAQTAAKGPAEALADAQRKLQSATAEAGNSSDRAADNYAKGWAGLKAKMGDFIRGSVADGVDGAEKEAEAGGKRAGGSFATSFKAGLAAIGTAAGVGALGGLLGDALEAGKGSDRIAASLGLNPADAKRAGAVAGSLFAGAYGDSMDDVNGAVEAVMSSVKGMRTASNADLESMTAKVLDLSSAFQIDAGRAAQVAGQLITTGLAKDGVEAADLLAGSLQKVPAAVREDLLDAVDEYGPFMQSLGITGSDAMGMLVSASEKGMYGIDKTGDALKEFGIRATDMSKTTAGAYEALGLDQEAMTAKLLAGGDSAKDAFGKIVNGLSSMKDPVAQSQAALALFGTPLEDLSVTEIPKFLGAIDPMGDAFDSMKGKAGELGTTLADNAGTRLETWKRSAQVAFVDILGNQVLPILENVGGFLGRTFGPIVGEIAGGIKAFGTAFGDAGTDITSSGLAGFLETLGMGLGGIWDILTKGDFTGKLTTAFGWDEDSAIVDFLFKVRDTFTEVVDGVKAFTAAWQANDGDVTSSGFPGFMERVAFWLRQAFDYVRDVVIPALGDFARFLWDNRGAIIAIVAGMVAYVATVKTLAIISAVRGWIAAASAAQWGLNAAMSANPVGLVVAGIVALVAGLAWFFTQTELGQDIVKNVWGFIQDAIGNTVKWWQDYVQPVAEQVFGFIGDAIKNVVDWVVQNWPLLLTILLGPLGAAIAWIIQNWSGIVGFFQGIFAQIGAVFTWLWTAVIQPTIGFIQTLIAGLVLWFQTVLLPGVQAVFAAVGAVFTWLWVNIIQPVFGFISAVFGAFWLLGQFIFNAVVAIIQKVIAPAFVWFYESVIKPVFDAVAKVVSDWWNGIVLPVFNFLVDFVTKKIPAAINWLHDNVFKPVFDKIGEVVTWIWENVISPTFDFWIDLFRNKIPAALNWLHDNVFKPVFDKISGVVTWLWDNIISPYFNFWIDLFTKTIPGAINWLHDHAIKPVMDKIGEVFTWVYDNVIKPVFDKIKTVVEKDVPAAFKAGVKFVEDIWKGIQEVVKAPIRFVVQTILNDGLIKSLNGIADFLGIDKLPNIELPPGFRDGGYTGNRPRGAVAGVVHGDEHVIRSESRRSIEATLPGLLDHMNTYGTLAGYAGGGRVAPLKELIITQGYNRVHKGIDYAAPVGTPVFATQDGVVSHAGPGARAPGVWGGTEVHILGDGIETWYAHLSRLAVGHGQNVHAGQQIADSGNTGISSGPHLHFGVFSGGWPNDVDPGAYLGGAGVPVGGKTGGGFNPVEAIIDGLMSKFKEAFPGSAMVVDLVGGLGKKILMGVSDFITGIFDGSRDKKGSAIGATLYDGGGWLENAGGLQLIDHQARRPDAVLTAPQWDTMLRIADGAAGPATEINFLGPVYGNPQHIVDEIEDRKRRAAVRNNLRAITVGG